MNTKLLQNMLAEFAEKRDWLQFHTPKNMAMAVSGEAAELLEIFQWLTPEESQQVMLSPKTAQEVKEEMADVLLNLLRLADILEVDLMQACLDKLQVNEQKYPVELSKGRARKYTELLHE